MPIKQTEVLPRADFDEAVLRLRLNVSAIAKDTGIPRTYLSEFRNGDRKLRPEHQAKLRDYFEGKGIEFDDGGGGDDAPPSPHPRLRAVESVRCFFPVADTVPDEVVTRTMDIMEDNDARLATLLKQVAERDDGIFGDGDFKEETKAALQEAGTILAENYVLFRMLRGWPAFGVKPAGESPETLRDVLRTAFRPRLEEAGLIQPEPAANDKAQSEAA
jgi:hypothetical protein